MTLGSDHPGSGATEYDGVSIFGGYLYDYTKEYLGSEEENENHLVSTEQFDVSGNTVTLEKVTVHDGTPVAVYGGAANVKGYSDYYGVYRDEAGNYTDWSYLSPLDVTATADASNNRVYIGTSAEAEPAVRSQTPKSGNLHRGDRATPAKALPRTTRWWSGTARLPCWLPAATRQNWMPMKTR
mgnify:CR=1 FL=1